MPVIWPLLLLAFLLFIAAVAGWLDRSLYGDLNITPLRVAAASAAAFLAWVSLEAGMSLLAFFLLFLAAISAYKVVSSLLYGDIEWGYVALLVLAAAALLVVSAREMAATAEPYLYNTTPPNTTS